MSSSVYPDAIKAILAIRPSMVFAGVVATRIASSLHRSERASCLAFASSTSGCSPAACQDASPGSMNLNSWSAGGYWTHVGPVGWYLDAVLQGTWYYGSASTQFARLNTDGTGFIASPESGYPFSWPQTRPGVR